MATLLNNLLINLTPAPHINPVEYDGLEYKWAMFVFRPALFKTELYFLAAVFVYIAFVTLGIYRNSSKINKWFATLRPILEQQFSKPFGSTGLTKDGYSDAYNFSTGRRNVTSLHTVFALKPRHDFIQSFYQFARGLIDLHYRPKDHLSLHFTLSSGALNHDFVWAIVAKDELLSIKDDRWDLTFTKTSESPSLPKSLSVMSEFADVTDNLLKPALVTILSDPKILPYFRSLSVTDQPNIRPTGPLPSNERQKRVIVSLAMPSGRSQDIADLVSAMFLYIDSLSNIDFRPETRTKLKKVREDVDKSLKADSEREKKEEMEQAAEDKKAAKRRLEEERISKLSAAEQQKIIEKERKRSLRKTQGKVIRK